MSEKPLEKYKKSSSNFLTKYQIGDPSMSSICIIMSTFKCQRPLVAAKSHQMEPLSILCQQKLILSVSQYRLVYSKKSLKPEEDPLNYIHFNHN
jgi:hypothetical protein